MSIATNTKKLNANARTSSELRLIGEVGDLLACLVWLKRLDYPLHDLEVFMDTYSYAEFLLRRVRGDREMALAISNKLLAKT